MNVHKGYNKIVSTPPTSGLEVQKQKRKKVLLILICSIVLLVTVLCVAIEFIHHGESSHDRIRSADLVVEVCNSTLHQKLCYTALQSCTEFQRGNVSELARIAVEVSRDEAIRVIQVAMDPKRTAGDKSLGALQDCGKLLSGTVDQLNTTASVLAEQGWKQRIADLKTWLSAALTNPATCVEGFVNLGVSMDEYLKQRIERVKDLVSNALSIVSFASDSKQSTENGP